MVFRGGEGSKNFRFPWAKGGDLKHPSLTNAVNLESPLKNEEIPVMAKIELAIKQYLQSVEQRNIQESKNRIGAVASGKEINTRIFRLPEAHLQNELLRIMYLNKIPIERISNIIKRTLASYQRDDLQELQKRVESILVGVESCTEAAIALKRNLQDRHPENETWIATNDQLDAGYMVDLVGFAENQDTNEVETLYLVQVKSSTSTETTEKIIKTHEQYLSMLPQLIGPLNKKSSSEIAEREVLNMENPKGSEVEKYKDSLEEILLFGLVLDQYIQENTKDDKTLTSINAKNFYENLKKEGSKLDPFIVIGILKNTKLLEEFRRKGYFEGNTQAEKLLTQTAEEIPHTEEEAISFYKKNNVNTILNATKIFSVVMVGGKEVKRVELAHPLSKEK